MLRRFCRIMPDPAYWIELSARGTNVNTVKARNTFICLQNAAKTASKQRNISAANS